MLNASKNTGNMINVAADGVGRDDRARVHLGKYVLKARLGNATLKYGLQQFSHPFLEGNQAPRYRARAISSFWMSLVPS